MATFPSKVDYATGDILTADNMNEIGGELNLLESAQFAAGKNKIINGDFGVWQRGTSFSNPASASFNADRFGFATDGSGATRTISQQTFTPGTAPVSGYEGQYFLRLDQTVQGTSTFALLQQSIEDVRTLAGQTVTFSFFAKCDTTRTLSADLIQSFGSGGSSNVNITAQTISATSSWQRFSLTFTVPSISGKTIGAGSFLRARLYISGASTFTMDTWGWQVEAGSTASNFQTATGTKQGELAACQRYYWRYDVAATQSFSLGFNASGSTCSTVIPFPVSMRTNPTALEQSGTAGDYSIATVAGVQTCTAVPVYSTANKYAATVEFTAATLLTGGQAARMRPVNANAFLGWSAEL